MPALALALPTAAAQDGPRRDADFDRVRELIHARTGGSLQLDEQALVPGRLAQRLRETRHRGLSSYLDALEPAAGPDGATKSQAVIDRLTTSRTSFFSEEHHFHTLQQDLVARRGQPARIWCAAASSGEEPYSLAMTLAENGGATMAQGTILCTDIDTTALATAQCGIYSAGAGGLSAERLQQHFLRDDGSDAGQIRVRPQLARLVEFRDFNLAQVAWASLGGPFDIVFCRNVMVHLDRTTRRRVLERLHAAMLPRGALYVGHSDQLTEARGLFRLRGKTIYERL